MTANKNIDYKLHNSIIWNKFKLISSKITMQELMIVCDVLVTEKG